MTLSEAIARKQADTNPELAAKLMAQIVVDRKNETDFNTDVYHAAPKAEMY